MYTITRVQQKPPNCCWAVSNSLTDFVTTSVTHLKPLRVYPRSQGEYTDNKSCHEVKQNYKYFLKYGISASSVTGCHEPDCLTSLCVHREKEKKKKITRYFITYVYLMCDVNALDSARRPRWCIRGREIRWLSQREQAPTLQTNLTRDWTKLSSDLRMHMQFTLHWRSPESSSPAQLGLLYIYSLVWPWSDV